METLRVSFRWALGDTVVLTALVRDLHLAYPGRFRLVADTAYPSALANNPGVLLPADAPGAAGKAFNLDYGAGIGASQGGRRVHFLAWLYEAFRAKAGVAVPLTAPRGELYLTAAERRPLVGGRYWVVVAGGKLDMTTKLWCPARWQAVVDGLAARGVRCVQAGSACRSHVHPPLTGLLRAVGRTESPRDLFTLIAGAEGVVCGVTAAMHVAAALEKPCVVVAGGREEPWWEWYTDAYRAFGPGARPVRVPHRFLHTLGRLDCCQKRGCWRKRTVPLERADLRDAKRIGELCARPVRAGPQPVPECLALITPQEVVAAVMSYYDDRTLPPPAGAAAPPGLPPLPALVHLPVGLPPAPPPPRPDAALPAWVRDPEAVKAQAPHQLQPPPEALTGPAPARLEAAAPADSGAVDHPALGGRVTVCVLCYGDHEDLARRCVGSILATVPAHRLDLRIAANACSPGTLAYLRAVPGAALDVSPANRLKYPVLRALLRDPARPVTTKYVVWFDDDSFAVDPNWLIRLADCVAANHRHNCRLYGITFQHDLQAYARAGHRPEQWFRAAPWWRGRDLRVRGGDRYAANGSLIDFVSGGFWAADYQALLAADAPDARLRHNGGDIVLGAQLHQAGFKVKDFNRGKVYVHSSGAPRRGFREDFPWARPAG